MISYINTNKTFYWILSGCFILFAGAAIYYEQNFLIGIPFVLLFVVFSWQHFTAVYFLLLFIIPFSFEYNFSPELGTDIPDEFLMWLITGLFFLRFIFSPNIISKTAWQHPLMIFLYLALSWIIVTVIFSTYPLISLKYLLAKSWYIIAFVFAPLIALKEKRSIKAAGMILSVSMLVIVLTALVRHAGYSFRFADINNAVYPFFRNHVNYSAMLVCVIPLFFAFYKLTPSIRKRSLIILGIIILLAALFFSYSRGAWLALAVGIFSYFLIQRRVLLLAFALTTFIAIAALFWIKSNDRYLQFAHDYRTTIFHKDFKEHLIATYHLKDVSTAERLYRWIAGIRMTRDNPLTGFGPNTFYNNYKPYGIPVFETWVSDNKEHSTVHNYFLLTAVEQGIPGLIFFLLLLGTSLFYAEKLYQRIKDLFYKTIAATVGVILSMLIVVNFLSDLIETDKPGSIFFLCIAMLIITDINTRKESDPATNI